MSLVLSFALVLVWTVALSWVPAAFKVFNSSYAEKLKTDANLMELSGWGARAQRALLNHHETLFAYLPVAVIAIVLGHLSSESFTDPQSSQLAVASSLYLIGRILHAICYIAAVPYARSVVWMVSTAAIVWMAVIVLGAL